MSDSVKKWHEMQEEKKIYESPDGGKTIRSRKIVEPKSLTEEEKKEAYKILAFYDTKVILHAASIINNDSTL